jgi:hypothetical protein
MRSGSPFRKSSRPRASIERKPDVARHAVVPQFQLDVVEKRVVRRPRVQVVDAQLAGAARDDIASGTDRHGRVRVGAHDPVGSRGQREVADPPLRHRLEPDAAPDPGCARVPDLVAAALLALRLPERVVDRIGDVDDELVLAAGLEPPEVEREMRVPALVRPDVRPVDRHVGAPVDGAEAEQRARAPVVRDAERAPVAQPLVHVGSRADPG